MLVDLFRKQGRKVTPSGLVRHLVHVQFAAHGIRVVPTASGHTKLTWRRGEGGDRELIERQARDFDRIVRDMRELMGLDEGTKDSSTATDASLEGDGRPKE